MNKNNGIFRAPPSRRRLLVLLTACLVQGGALAEDAAAPSITVSAEPIVGGEAPDRTAVDAAVVKRSRAATSDTASLLENVPGVTSYGAGGVSSLPSLHGLADDRLRIKVDGMDLISACGNHMNPPLSYIDPTSVSNAQVFAGITPVSVGGDSIGGAILVDSADPEFAQPGAGLLTKGEVGANFRSNGNVRGGNVKATIANENLSVTYRGSTIKSDDYKAGGAFKPAGPAAAGRDWLDADEVGSTYYDSTNHALDLGLRNGNHLFELTLGLQDISDQGYPNQRMDMTGNDSTQINFGYKGEFDWGSLDARAYREHTRHKMQFGDDKLFWYGPNPPAPNADGVPCTPSGGPAGCAAGMPMDTEGDNRGLQLKAEIPLSLRDMLRVGGELQRYRLDDWWEPSGKGMWPDTFLNINDGQRDRLALFAEWEAQWDPQWLTQLGVRGERVSMDTGEVQGYSASPTYAAEAATFNAADRDKTDNNLDLTALARFTPDRNRSIEFGYARKTRSPNLYERYAWSTGGMAMRMINMAGDGNGYVGNLDLEPEIAHTLSATFDWHAANGDDWGLKLTPYFTYVDDYIDAKRCSSANAECDADNQIENNDFVYLQFVNQSARLYGLDISGHYPLAKGTRFGRFIARGAVSYVRGENRDTGDNLYNMMPLNAKLAVEQQYSGWTNALEVELVDNKSDVSSVRNELETDSYALLHLRSSYEWKQLRLDFGVENLFDKFYNHPLGGAYTGQGKTMSGTGVPWGTAVPGMGRSLYAGVNYSF